MKLDTKYVEAVRKIVEYMELVPDELHPRRDVWEWFDVKVEPNVLKKLFLDGVIEESFFTAKHKHYTANLERLKELLVENGPKEPLKQLKELQPCNVGELFQDIQGLESVKALFRLSLQSTEPVHILMVSPPGSAKTMLLEELGEKLPNSMFVLGSSLTKAGLNDHLFERFCDGEVCHLLIDEVDKMTMRDYAVLLSLMETGLVKDTKSGKSRTMKLKAWVFGAANRVDRVPLENMDRFQVVHLPVWTGDEFGNNMTSILVHRYNIDKETCSYILGKLDHGNSIRCIFRFVRLLGGDYSQHNVDKVLGILGELEERCVV